eukprot:8566357-Pyramimonas_sp.AAC.1
MAIYHLCSSTTTNGIVCTPFKVGDAWITHQLSRTPEGRYIVRVPDCRVAPPAVTAHLVSKTHHRRGPSSSDAEPLSMHHQARVMRGLVIRRHRKEPSDASQESASDGSTRRGHRGHRHCGIAIRKKKTQWTERRPSSSSKISAHDHVDDI